jgi:hypothetical protein
MMNNIDLPAMIRDCVDGGTRPVTSGEIESRAATAARRVSAVDGLAVGGPRRAPAAGGRRRVLTMSGLAVTGLAAAGAVAGLVASQAGGPASAPAATRAVLTAAMVRHVASASQAAMTSGVASIDWTSSGLPGVVQQISFNGGNWNDVLNPGQPLHVTHTAQGITQTGESINRVVNGTQYHYPAIKMTPKGPEFTSGWMIFGPQGSAPALSIPDPRTLLSVLSPSAGFVTAGTSTVNGVAVTHLQATTPGAVAITPLNDIIQSEPDNARLSAINLWVDANDVVQKAEVTVSGTNGKGAPQSATVTVTFSQIGQLQPITPPASYTRLGGKP